MQGRLYSTASLKSSTKMRLRPNCFASACSQRRGNTRHRNLDHVLASCCILLYDPLKNNVKVPAQTRASSHSATGTTFFSDDTFKASDFKAHPPRSCETYATLLHFIANVGEKGVYCPGNIWKMTALPHITHVLGQDVATLMLQLSSKVFGLRTHKLLTLSVHGKVSKPYIETL